MPLYSAVWIRPSGIHKFQMDEFHHRTSSLLRSSYGELLKKQPA
jgi:hypothetical protein